MIKYMFCVATKKSVFKISYTSDLLNKLMYWAVVDFLHCCVVTLIVN